MSLIRASDLQVLRDLTGKGGPVVSLYLNVTPPRPFKSELRSLIHDKWEKLQAAGLDKDLLRRIEAIFASLRAYVDELRPLERTRLLAIFAAEEDFFQEYRLPVALPSRLYVDPDPYIRPLTVLLDEFNRYCVVLVDRKRARAFDMYLGEMEEDVGALVSETPSWISEGEGRAARGTAAGTGPWAGWRESKIQRHIADHVHRHFKEVAGLLFDHFKRRGFDRLIVGGPEGAEGKVVPEFLDHLHSYLRERLAGVFAGEMDLPVNEIKKRALEVAAREERREEEALIERLLSEANREDGLGVLGLNDVVLALMMSQVHTLVLEHDYQERGWICPRDHHLALAGETCPLCGGELEEVEDFVDEVVEEAIEQGAEVEHVFTEHEGFRNWRIGAILRFRVY
ncbi:baeRF10 domain-containing protein [Candidatus Bipolaricaulota sp. J31]